VHPKAAAKWGAKKLPKKVVTDGVGRKQEELPQIVVEGDLHAAKVLSNLVESVVCGVGVSFSSDMLRLLVEELDALVVAVNPVQFRTTQLTPPLKLKSTIPAIAIT
jgi:hypothetical protein